MVNYNNGKIYKIEPLNGEEGDIYIGSTTKEYLSQRMDSRGSYADCGALTLKVFQTLVNCSPQIAPFRKDRSGTYVMLTMPELKPTGFETLGEATAEILEIRMN